MTKMSKLKDYEPTSFTHGCGRHESTYWRSNNDQRQVWFLPLDFLEMESFGQFYRTTSRIGAIFFFQEIFFTDLFRLKNF